MPASRRGTGFINFQDYLGLNQAGAQQLGVNLANQQSQGNNAVLGAIDTGTSDFAKRVDAGKATGPGGTYQGPKQLDTAPYDVAIADQQKRSAMLGDQAGRTALMNKPGQDQTWGGSQLDAALAGAGGGAAAISSAQAGTNRLKDYLGLSTSNAAQYAGQQAATPYANTYQGPAQRAPTQAAQDRVDRSKQDRRGRERNTYIP